MSPELTLPKCLSAHLPQQENQSHDALAVSAICGVVEDMRAHVSPEEFSALEETLKRSRSSDIKETRKKGVHKMKASRISPYGDHTVVTTVDQNPEKFQIPTPELNRGLGGGAFNSLVDSALLVKFLLEKTRDTDHEIPTGHIAFPAIEELRKQVRYAIAHAEVENLAITQLKGATRRSIFVTTDGHDRQLSFSTSQASIETPPEEFPKVENPRYILVNNEPPESDTFKHLISAREKPTNERPQAIVWSVGSNQIKEGITNFTTFLGECDTVILNLDEAVDWIRSHLSPDYYNDKALVDLLETPPEEEVRRIRDMAMKAIKAMLVPPQKGREIKRVPEDPETRQIIAQRCADLLHRLGLKGSAFITDGTNPTVISRKRVNSVGGITKRQYAIPILPTKRGLEIDAIIRTYNAEPAEDPTGCGDSVAASILALKQVSSNKVKPTTVAIVANYISALLYRMPHSNLLEVEAEFPGITRKIIDLALNKMDDVDSLLYRDHKLPLIDESKKTDRSSPYFHMTN